uniref:Uncharacterized protein n=1 Tax=Amazona collaria TaxID=241587 RepID=A0A8B9F2K0_9PSIT
MLVERSSSVKAMECNPLPSSWPLPTQQRLKKIRRFCWTLWATAIPSTRTSPRAQQLALQTLRVMQDVLGEVPTAVVEPFLSVLRSTHLQVQHEAIQLLKVLMAHQVRAALLEGLVALLTPSWRKELTFCSEPAKDPATLGLKEPKLVYTQQAAAAKIIGVLAKEAGEVAEELIQMKVVHGLMVAVGNLDHVVSQRYASISLEDSPGTWYTKMDPLQAEVLASTVIDIP